jgi:hypothetical protein
MLAIILAILFGGGIAAAILFTEQGHKLRTKIFNLLGRGDSDAETDQEDDNSISTPFNVIHKVFKPLRNHFHKRSRLDLNVGLTSIFKVHVNRDFTWKGEDPLSIFRLEEKLGEGFVFDRTHLPFN